MTSHREKILSALRQATKVPSRLPDEPDGIDEKIRTGLASVTPPDGKGLQEQFIRELENVSGECHVVRNPKEIADIMAPILRESDYKTIAVPGTETAARVAKYVAKELKVEIVDVSQLDFAERRQKLADTPAAIVTADYAVADVASLAVLYDSTPSTLVHFLPDCIFAIVPASKLVANQFELFQRIPSHRAKDMVLITGPSRTADIEKVLVLGAHGPRRLVVFLTQEG